MKNKFLLMAVISALAALVIVPSTMAATGEDTPVSTSVTSGDFIFSASGVYESEIQLSSVQVSSDPGKSTKDNAFSANDNFKLIDYDGNQGASIKMALTTDFIYDGAVSGANNIDGEEEFSYSMRVSGSDPAVATCQSDLDGYGTGCVYVKGASSNLISTSDFTIDPSLTTGSTSFFYRHAEVNATPTRDLLTTTTRAPYVVKFGLQRFELGIPPNSAQGSYASTLYLLALPGAE